MKGPKVKGRGVNSGALDIKEVGGSILVRVDDAKNAEFWLEIRLTRDDIIDMLAKLDAAEFR